MHPEITKESIATVFQEIADMLQIMDENVFRVRAYQRASEIVRTTSATLDQLDENLPGIGKDLHSKILELIETGRCEMHEQLKAKIGPGVLDLLRLRGIGPKKVKLFYVQLGIDSLDKLKAAAESGALATLPGMGEKSEHSILEALQNQSIGKVRIPYETALKEAKAYIKHMKKHKGVERIEFAGSLRRKRSTIGDVDLLVQGTDIEGLMDHFAKYPKVEQVLGRGETKSSVLLEGNIQVDLRIVPEESFGAALFYFTGTKQFNIYVRTIALRKGWKVNEYGLYDGEKKIAGRTEEELFKALDIDYLTPEQREEWK